MAGLPVLHPFAVMSVHGAEHRNVEVLDRFSPPATRQEAPVPQVELQLGAMPWHGGCVCVEPHKNLFMVENLANASPSTRVMGLASKSRHCRLVSPLNAPISIVVIKFMANTRSVQLPKAENMLAGRKESWLFESQRHCRLVNPLNVPISIDVIRLSSSRLQKSSH